MKKIYLLFLATLLSAQELKIIEVLDANLFRIADSTLISLANLDAPSINDSDSTRVELAQNIVKYAKLMFKGYSIRFERSPDKCSSGEIIKGHIFRIYPLSENNINAAYLQNGYAVYLPCDTLYMETYTKNAKMGMDKKKGIWKTHLVQRCLNYYNRFRVSWPFFGDDFFDSTIPLIGFNYRWSDFPFIKMNIAD